MIYYRLSGVGLSLWLEANDLRITLGLRGVGKQRGNEAGMREYDLVHGGSRLCVGMNPWDQSYIQAEMRNAGMPAG
ncbi:hypothetical protein GCM10009102_29300 [Sphingomonas insulae]|uniref:Uncharacterized protein n=1 Tax=Sphingomonas insulae TaxID=424800 RepID=A0ABN1HZH9_9SPHN